MAAMNPTQSSRRLGYSVVDRLARTWVLLGCLVGRHEWEKQRGTFGPSQVAPNGKFYEAFYCIWCGRGYPCHSIARKIWDEVRDR